MFSQFAKRLASARKFPALLSGAFVDFGDSTWINKYYISKCQINKLAEDKYSVCVSAPTIGVAGVGDNNQFKFTEAYYENCREFKTYNEALEFVTTQIHY